MPAFDESAATPLSQMGSKQPLKLRCDPEKSIRPLHSHLLEAEGSHGETVRTLVRAENAPRSSLVLSRVSPWPLQWQEL